MRMPTRCLELEPGQNVASHGIDRNLDIGEAGALTAVRLPAAIERGLHRVTRSGT
jgi:hypothetical protein